MYDLNSIREYTKNNISIFEAGEIKADLLGTSVIMKDVIITIDQDEIFFIPEVYANENAYVEAKTMYPILIHETTKKFKVDYSEPLEIQSSWMWPLAFAVLIHFHDHADGIRQKTFSKLFKEKVLDAVKG